MRTKLSSLLVYAILVIGALIMVAPFLLMVSGSLMTFAEIISPPFSVVPESPQFGNYIDAMQTGTWGRWILNSIYVTAMATGLSLLLNAMAGYGFARLRFPGRQWLFYLALIGLMLPPEVTLVPTFLIMARFPLAGGNSILGAGGTGFIDTFTGLILPYIAGSVGVFLSRQYYLGFPSALDDAATIDGCGRVRTFTHIYLPLSGPMLASLGILKATFAWNQYAWPLVITTSQEMRTVQLALAIFQSENLIQWHLLLAATTVIVLPLLVAFIFGQRFFISGVTTSGIKG